MKTGALRITPEILRLIAELDEFKGTWRTLTTLAPERLAVLKHVITISHHWLFVSDCLTNCIQQDHRGIKQRYYPMLGFKTFALL